MLDAIYRHYNNEISSQIFSSMQYHNEKQLLDTLQNLEQNIIDEVILENDTQFNENLIVHAIKINWANGVDILISKLSKDKLKECLLKRNISCNLSILQLLAIMPYADNVYKKAKQLSGLNSKTVTTYYCESPSFLRKCFRHNPSIFSTENNKENKQSYIYIQTGTKENPIEEKLTFSELQLKYKHLFSYPPQHFKLIPQANQINETIVRSSDEKLQALDTYLKRLLSDREENGLALCQIFEDDEGKDLSHLNLGLGVKTRRAYKKGEIVCLYGGELDSDDPENADYSIYRETSYNQRIKVVKLSNGINIEKIYQNDSFTGLKFRSYGSMVQHSCPNVKFDSINTMTDEIQVLLAIEDIPENTYVCVDYGVCAKWEWIELRPRAFKEVLKTNYHQSFEYLHYVLNNKKPTTP